MTRIKDGDNFTIENDKDYLRLAERIKETTSGEGEYVVNRFPSEEEKQAMGMLGQTITNETNSLNNIVFKQNTDLKIQRIH